MGIVIVKFDVIDGSNKLEAALGAGEIFEGGGGLGLIKAQESRGSNSGGSVGLIKVTGKVKFKIRIAGVSLIFDFKLGQNGLVDLGVGTD